MYGSRRHSRTTPKERTETVLTTFSASDGAELAYDLEGRGAPLLCIPGGPGRDPAYMEGLGGLAAGRQLVVLHPRGAGRSPHSADPADYGAERLARDSLELAERLGEGQIDLLGHSAGTFAAVLAATDERDKVRRLVLVTPTRMLAPEVPDDTEDILAARSSEPWYGEVQDALRGADPESAAEVIAMVRKVSPAFYGGWGSSQQRHADQLQDQVNLETMDNTPDPPALELKSGELNLDTLVITGAQDAASGTAVGDAIADFFANGRHIIMPGCGHYPWVDEPKQFVSIISAFLDEG